MWQFLLPWSAINLASHPPKLWLGYGASEVFVWCPLLMMVEISPTSLAQPDNFGFLEVVVFVLSLCWWVSPEQPSLTFSISSVSFWHP